MDEWLARAAEEIATRAERELEALVGVSTPSGDHAGAEEVLAICAALLPVEARTERLPCSTPGNPRDLLATLRGGGRRRLLLLGHVDTVFAHHEHVPLRRDGERLIGSGTADMKGGVVLSLGAVRALAARTERFAEIDLLLVTDEEWRMAPFVHAERFAGYDACLCFEAGELGPAGEEGVVVTRKAAGTMRVSARGRAAHSGSAPDKGRNALLALARTAVRVASHHEPAGADRLSVVPTVMSSGSALNVVPAAGELTFDVRAVSARAFRALLEAVPAEDEGVRLEAGMVREWPGMDTRAETAELLAAASRTLGRPVLGVSRGGASDASHFAASIPLTVDGLGPRGGGAHTPEEFVLTASLRERAEVALALVDAALGPAIL